MNCKNNNTKKKNKTKTFKLTCDNELQLCCAIQFNNYPVWLSCWAED